MKIENMGLDASSGNEMASSIGGGAERELVYVGFWRRLASHLVDIAILNPYALFSTWIAYRSKEGFLVAQAVGIVIAVAAAGRDDAVSG